MAEPISKPDEPKEKKIKEPRLPVTAELLANIKKLGGLGLTKQQICNYYGYSLTGWDAKTAKHPEIDTAMKQGRSEKISIASGKLWEAIERGNLSAIIFFLKTQARWSENSPPPDGDGDQGKPAFPAITLTVSDPVEAARIYQQIMIGS